MQKSSDPATQEMGNSLAKTDPSDIDYVEVKQPVAKDGSLQPIQVSKYGPSETPAEPADDEGGDL